MDRPPSQCGVLSKRYGGGRVTMDCGKVSLPAPDRRPYAVLLEPLCELSH